MNSQQPTSFAARLGWPMILAGLSLAASPLLAAGLVLEGGTIHPVSGTSYAGQVWIDGGEIRAVGATVAAPADVERLDISGLHVYPGMIDAMGQLGLTEIGSVPATVDTTEIGKFNPHLHSATAIHPASEVIPVTRANGITHAIVAPASNNEGIIAGQAAVIHLAGWTVEEMAIEAAAAMVIKWPAIQIRSFDFATFTLKEAPFGEAKEKAEKAQNELRDWFDAARHYAQASSAERTEANLKLAALAQVLDGGQPVIIQADSQRDIEAAVAFAEEQGLKMILAGGRDAWKVKELLAEKSIPVILGRPQSLPAEQDHPYDRPFRTAGELVEAGIRIAFGSSAGGGFGPGGPHGARTLPWEAATAVAYGLPAGEAIKALTVNAAIMLGLEEQLGTIDAGKIANLIVTDGNPLEITTQIHHLIIAGQQVSTDNRHQALFEHHRSRPARSGE